ncbi:restriction endonuclease [Pseudofrankia sp. BMG5.37]|uniref:nSTAND3 domain-containing NTPase n=1 Tax=Pseudofrankia sp. BMG5.37 TaxID=3050035 RepID=UPI00289482BE|nr:restriction endonuclease [Pseudofrankia sp. BMG5.37]MDT3445988.1 restriction endonuclease [Pseudofrankia sp. BMG5.37]
MDTFDLRRLTDVDFELICKDLFEGILGVHLEVFSPGADQGIDLRHVAEGSGSTTVIQCKHWARAGRAKLLAHMRNIELKKVQRLRPSRYILACSVELTPNAKRTLLSDLSPYIKNSGDIYGIQEIESELRKRPQIIQSHPRLWLNSTAILQGVLAKDILTRSSALFDEIDHSLKCYVPSENLPRGREILEDSHTLLISGAPGIGKTTLAHALLADYASRGFDVVDISADASEINRLWLPGARQIFYYDDFLGQATLVDKFQKNEESRLLNIIRRVKFASDKRLILTTREYILAQARQQYEKLAETDLTPLKYVMDLADYTPEIRAQILYNHIYFSNLPDENKIIFADPAHYRRIIRHSNFNPRIIQVSANKHAPGEAPEATAQRLHDDLQDPRRVWEHVVKNQLDDATVALLEIVFSLGEFPVDGLRAAWLAYTSPVGDSRSFRRAIQLSEGTLVKVINRADGPWLDFHDPSVRDYMIGYLSDHPEVVGRLVEKAIFFEQIWGLWILAESDRGNSVIEKLRGLQILSKCIKKTFDSPYLRSKNANWRLGRANAVLAIGERFDSPDLFDFIDSKVLRYVDFNEDAAGSDEVAELLRRLSDSEYKSAQKRAISLVGRAIDYITEDADDLDGKSYAEAVLMTLSEVALEEVRSEALSAASSIGDSIHDRISYTFDEWRAGRIESWDMGDVIEQASHYENPEEVFPGYFDVTSDISAMKSYMADDEPPSDTRLREIETPPSVDHILGALRNTIE